MTKEEHAIDMLSMIKVDKYGEFEHLHTWYKGIDKDMQEAVEMAISALNKRRDKTSDNILRRIANNHQVSFEIEAMSWDPIGGVQITSTKEGEDGTKYHERFEIPRFEINNANFPNDILITVLTNLLNNMEEGE